MRKKKKGTEPKVVFGKRERKIRRRKRKKRKSI